MEAEPSTKALTEEVMGISRPIDLAFWLTANAVATPSMVMFLLKGFWHQVIRQKQNYETFLNYK